MSKEKIVRRDFLKAMLAGIPALSLDWDSFPRGDRPPGSTGRSGRSAAGESCDAVIIGARLGGERWAAGAGQARPKLPKLVRGKGGGRGQPPRLIKSSLHPVVERGSLVPEE